LGEISGTDLRLGAHPRTRNSLSYALSEREDKTDDTLKIRFSARLGEEPEFEVALA
jgi:hypothetical protein